MGKSNKLNHIILNKLNNITAKSISNVAVINQSERHTHSNWSIATIQHYANRVTQVTLM
jgi:hypothetical protein